jgi:hypothetical protein
MAGTTLTSAALPLALAGVSVLAITARPKAQ